MTSLPTFFLSHGAPTVVIEKTPLSVFLRGLAGQVKPSAILLATAHWLTEYPALTSAKAPETIHDFGGFPDELYRMTYSAPGSPALAERAAGLLDAAGLKVGLNPTRGLDHGTWTPLMLAWPKADIPVVQLSVQPQLDPAHHYRLGQALAPLRDEGVLIIASGAFTHNLAAYFAPRHQAALQTETASEFADWIDNALTRDNINDLLNYRTRAPHARAAHPTDEHFLPLFVALGAAGPNAPSLNIHSSGINALRNDCYRFG